MEKKTVFIFFLLLCYFSFFLRLTSYPLLMWDESRFAVNAFEMLKTNNFIVITYDGVPDLWNTKPPLSIWIMSFFMKCFGYSDLVVRLPSAIAATITAISIYRFVLKHLKDVVAAFFSGMVLISSVGFIGMHVARTGDADSLAVLFITLFAIYYYNSIEKASASEIDKRALYISSLFFALALLTKSSYAFFVLPGILVYILITGKWKILVNKHFYLAAILSLLPLLLYYLLREHQNPGYLKAVWVNEYGGRFSETVEKHAHPFYYYFVQLLNYRYFYWLYFFLIGIPFLLKGKSSAGNKIARYCALSGFSILLVISFSKTKLDWYDAAVFPFFSIVCGILLSKLAGLLIAYFMVRKAFYTKVIYVLFFIIIFFYPYRKVLSYINIKPGEAAYIRLKYGPFMKQLYKENPNDSVVFYENVYNSQLLYYTKTFKEEGKKVEIVNSLDRLKEGDKIAACVPELKDQIRSSFEVEVKQEDNYCTCYKIVKKY